MDREEDLKRYKDLIRTVSNGIKVMFVISAVLLVILYVYFKESNLTLVAVCFFMCLIFAFIFSAIKRMLVVKCRAIIDEIERENKRN